MNLFKAVRAIFAASKFIVLVAPALAELPNVAKPTPDKATLDYGLKATKLAGGWYVIAGANDDFSQANGCNIINTGFYMDDSGVYVINTGTSRIYGEQQRTLINSVSTVSYTHLRAHET